MDNINWNDIPEASVGGYEQPEPGGYAAVITNIIDDPRKKYLQVEWDFAEGSFKGDNNRCFTEQNFWPSYGIMYKTYDAAKRKGLGLTKKFITRLEQTNRGFRFSNENPRSCIGRFICVILGEEEYFSTKHNEVRTRLYTADVCSGDELRRKAYTVPPLRKYKGQPAAAGGINVPPPPADWDAPAAPAPATPQSYQQTRMGSYAATPPAYGNCGNAAPAGFAELPPDDDGDLPF